MGPAGCGRVPGRAVGEGGWPLSAVAARGAVDEPTAVRRGLHGPPAAAGEPWGASAVRMGSRGRPDELWSFPATRGAGWRAGGGGGGGDEAVRKVVRARWAASGGVPRVVQLVLDSTVVLRYGAKQAGAEKGYNPRKKGRPSHHPLLAFLDTGDCLGVQWRPGNANTAAGTEAWLEELVKWLREQGVQR